MLRLNLCSQATYHNNDTEDRSRTSVPVAAKGIVDRVLVNGIVNFSMTNAT